MSAQILENLSGRSQQGNHSPVEKLTDREFEVFELIGQGLAHIGMHLEQRVHACACHAISGGGCVITYLHEFLYTR